MKSGGLRFHTQFDAAQSLVRLGEVVLGHDNIWRQKKSSTSKAILSKPKALEIFFLSATTTVISLDASNATQRGRTDTNCMYCIASAAVKKETLGNTQQYIYTYTVSSDLTYTN